jgi:hypothetical protein
MQTLIVVKMEGVQSFDVKERLRRKFMKDIEEGLLVIDDTISITSHTVQGEVGIEFNKE